MPKRSAIPVILMLLAGAIEDHALEQLPVPVFVTTVETPALPPLEPEVHKAAIKQARDEMFNVAEQLRKQHGQKTSDWPPEVWNLFYVAEDTHLLAIARRDYEAPESRLGLADSVEDVVRGASSNKALSMATAGEGASLVVQIVGRRRAPASGPTDNRYFIRFRVAPGAKLTRARFVELTQGYKWDSPWSKVLAHPKSDAEYFELEAGSPASYKNCAGMMRSIVEGFVEARMDDVKKR
jgi:hypothetical protein